MAFYTITMALRDLKTILAYTIRRSLLLTFNALLPKWALVSRYRHDFGELEPRKVAPCNLYSERDLQASNELAAFFVLHKIRTSSPRHCRDVTLRLFFFV